MQADVAKIDDVTRLVDEAWDMFGRVDILVNNAGVNREMAFLELSEGIWDRVLSVNLKGAFLCGQAVARKMVKNRIPGKIIKVEFAIRKVLFRQYDTYQS